jgi:outer membrane protein assembly factor BamB
MKHFIVLALVTACAVDDPDAAPYVPPPPGTGSGSGDPMPPPGTGAGALGGDPMLNTIVLSSKDTQIVAVDPNAGGRRVVTDFGNGIDIESLAYVGGNIVYAGAEDNSMNAVNLTNGALIWETPLGRYENSELASPQVVIRDSVIYGAGIPGVLAARDLSQAAVKWDYAMSPSGETDSYYSSVGRPLVTADRVFIGTHSSLDQNYLHAIDRTTGARVWRIELPDAMSGTPRLAGNRLLVPAGHLYALDPANGAVVWTFAQEPLSRGASTPAIAGDVVLVQGADAVAAGRLYALDLATGARKWAIDAGNDYAGVYTPRVVGGVVLGVSERGSSQWGYGNGLPFAADIATGAIVWKNADVSVATSPVFANGRLFFHGQNFKGTGDIDDNVGLMMLDGPTGKLIALDNYFRYANAVRPLVIATNGVFD